MADGCRKIVFFGHNKATECPISAQSCKRKQNGMPIKVTRQKLKFRKHETAYDTSRYLSEKSYDSDQICYT